MSVEPYEGNGNQSPQLTPRLVDSAGRLLPISEDERRERLPLELASLREAWAIPVDSSDSDEVWGEILRNLGVDPITGRGLEP